MKFQIGMVPQSVEEHVVQMYGMLDKIMERVEETKDHDDRIQRLENFKTLALILGGGLWAVMLVLIAAVADAIFKGGKLP